MKREMTDEPTLARARKRWRALTARLRQDPDLRTACAYVLALAALRADFIWLGDTIQALWRAATLALLAGFVQDLGVTALVLGLVPSGQVGSRVRVGLFALGTFLGVLNLRTLAALNVPFDPLMLTYLSDPLRVREMQSPIPLRLLFLHASVALGFIFLVRRPRRWVSPDTFAGWSARRAVVTAALGGSLLFGSRAFAGLDYRATQVSHADGFSWLWFQLRGRSFGLPPGTEPRAALLTPAARAGTSFVDARFPLARGTPHALCRAGRGSACDADEDDDGAPLRADCNDHDRAIRPGAADSTADGIDQDCSGFDAVTPDVLVLELEGLPSNVLAATGAEGVDRVAPELEALAQRPDARLFTHYETAAGQTAPGFASAMCSLLPHYGAGITRAFAHIGLRCLPGVLVERGYEARMVQNGDPSFDNQRAFALRAGFQRIEDSNDIERGLGRAERVSKWGVVDGALFDYLAQLLAARHAGDPPLFLLAQSITNHYPYALPDPKYARPGPGTETWQKVRGTSAYVDAMLGRLVRELDRLARVPGRRPLVVVLSGDHGHPAEIHPGNRNPASALYDENVHTPFVIWSPAGEERLARFRDTDLALPCSSIDLMPTVLGLLGVQAIHAAMGRDLALPSAEPDQRAISLNPLAGGLVRVRRTSGSVIVRALPPALEAYAASDGRELHDLGERAPGATAAAHEALSAVFAAKALIQSDRLWSDELLRPLGQPARHAATESER
jgi:hypothetical protein